MKSKYKNWMISILIALIVIVFPIFPYKFQTDRCMLASQIVPDVCVHTYIPFEEGFPFKFYDQYGPGFQLISHLEFLGMNIKLSNCNDTACEPPISWVVPFFLNVLILSTSSYILLKVVNKLTIKRRGS